MTDSPTDIFTEPDADVDTLRSLADPFHHTNRNTLTKIGDPTPNPLAAAAR